jgi:outer membrane protein OmpA-like peptidoglycan-associated protein
LAGYSQRLSKRRANAVATPSRILAVPSGDMAVSGHGIDYPRVPPRWGVREPQNRRAKIVFP